MPAGQYTDADSPGEPQEPVQRQSAPLHVNMPPTERRSAGSPPPLPGYVGNDDPLATPPGPDGRRVLHSEQRDPASAFGTPGPPREYRRSRPTATPPPTDMANPWSDLKDPPKKGTSFWQGVLIWLFFPFRMIAYITRKLPRVIRFVVRFCISTAFVGSIFALFLVLFYAIKSGRYDLTQVMRMPERTIVLDRKGNEIGTLHG